MIAAMVYAYFGPYCVSFGGNSQLDKATCSILTIMSYPVILLYIADIFVEIIAAAPVYGIVSFYFILHNSCT